MVEAWGSRGCVCAFARNAARPRKVTLAVRKYTRKYVDVIADVDADEATDSTNVPAAPVFPRFKSAGHMRTALGPAGTE